LNRSVCDRLHLVTWTDATCHIEVMTVYAVTFSGEMLVSAKKILSNEALLLFGAQIVVLLYNFVQELTKVWVVYYRKSVSYKRL